MEKEIYQFDDVHPEMDFCNYSDILEELGIEWEMESMEQADVSLLDGRMVAVLLRGAVRADRFCEGALLSFCKSGCIKRFLERLKSIDESCAGE